MKKLAIIEDNHQYRKVLEYIFTNHPAYRIVHFLENAEQIQMAFADELVDIVIMDIDLPGKNGIEATRFIKTTYPDIKILMLTVFEDADKLFEAVKAGANGYLLKKDSPARILEAVEQLDRDESPINSILASKMLDYFRQKTPEHEREEEAAQLTAREKEILQHLVNGYSYKEIAAFCNITFQTLNSHTKRIYQKLNVHSRSEATARYGRLF